jgi:hypothetical protein
MMIFIMFQILPCLPLPPLIHLTLLLTQPLTLLFIIHQYRIPLLLLTLLNQICLMIHPLLL